MKMPRKDRSTKTPIESIRHKDKRKNIPTEELRDFVAQDENAPKTMLYPRDPSLDPQLVWKGKVQTIYLDPPYGIKFGSNWQVSTRKRDVKDDKAKNYVPDFIACIDDSHGRDDLLNLLIEVTGEKKKDKAAKVSAARTLWIPAVNNHGGFGRWAFIEIADPWDAMNAIRASLQKGTEL